MKNNNKFDVADDSSSFSCLPDDIVLQISRFQNLVPLQTRFQTFQGDYPSSRHYFLHLLFQSPCRPSRPSRLASLGSYCKSIKCLENFGRVKSLRIQVPSSFDSNHLLFKWMIKFGIRVDSFVFVSPNSVFPNKELCVSANGQEEEDRVLFRKKFNTACECLKDVIVKLRLLMLPITGLPLLQDVCFADPDQKVRVSLNGEKVAEMRNLFEAGDEELDMHFIDIPSRISDCYVPLLKYPVSGYVMKGVTLHLFGRNDILDDDIDSFMKIDLNDFEDKEEAAYREAVIEIVKKHRSRIVTRS